MAQITVRVWVNGDPSKDAPFLETAGDRPRIETLAKGEHLDDAALNRAVACAVCGEAGDLLVHFAQDAETTPQVRDAQIAALDAQKAVLQAVKAPAVDTSVIDALKK